MKTDYIYKEAERAVRRSGSRDPWELIDSQKAFTKLSDSYAADGLKGYCKIMNGIKFVVVNSKLSGTDRDIVAGHEGAHLVLHSDIIRNNAGGFLSDLSVYGGSGRIEYEANLFLADFLLDDHDVLDSICAEDATIFSTASELYVPAPLLGFKFFSMARRGYNIRVPVDIESRFLK